MIKWALTCLILVIAHQLASIHQDSSFILSLNVTDLALPQLSDSVEIVRKQRRQ